MTYEMSAYQAHKTNAESKRARAAMVGFLIGFFIAGAAFMATALSGPEQDSLLAVLLFSFMVGVSFGGASGIVGAGVYDLGLAPKSMLHPLPSGAKMMIGAIENNYAAIMKLHPPATVVDELAELRQQHGEVVNELISLAVALPDEDLTSSAPFRWLCKLDQDLLELKSELQAVRLQGYSIPRPVFSLEESKTAVAEERAFIEAVLKNDSEGDYMDRILNFDRDAIVVRDKS